MQTDGKTATNTQTDNTDRKHRQKKTDSKKIKDWLRPVARTAQRGYILLTAKKIGKICQKGKELRLIENLKNLNLKNLKI